MKRSYLVVVLLFAALLALGQGATTHVRGVRPELASKYEPQAGKFECLDGSKTIDFARVNDDWCDCPDGSDEPGASLLS